MIQFSLAPQSYLGGCGTFYAIVIGSKKFHGLPMVKQHRLVTDTLKAEIEGIHGLQVHGSQRVLVAIVLMLLVR